MTMESGGERPNEADEQPSEESENWYFNMPGGAWERQEEKNRELRERVQRNLDNPAPHTDPFASPKTNDERGFFGREQKQEEPEGHTTAGGTFRLAKGGFQAAEPPAEADADDGDWSSEPLLPLRRRAVDESPLPLPSTDWDTDDDARGEDIQNSMHKGSSSSTGGGPASDASSPSIPVEPADPRPPSLPLTFKLTRPESEAATEDDKPSRWRDTFFAGGEESGGLRSMREWAESGPVLPPREEPRDQPADIPAEFLKPFDWEIEEAVAATSSEIPAEFLKPFEWEATPEPAEARPTGPSVVEPVNALMPSALHDEHPSEFLSAPESGDESLQADLSPLHAERPASIPPIETSEDKPAGLFGRLFGHKKQHQAAEKPPEAETAGPTQRAADWVTDAETAGNGGALPTTSSEAESIPEESPWRWPAEPAAVTVDEAAPAFEAAPTVEVESRPVSEESPWTWPAEAAAVTVDEAAPAFEAAPSVEVESQPVSDESPWTWPAEAAAVTVDEAAPAFEA
ncbi:MAG: hypothetical protein ABI939_06470, partial [Anaerolineaceae bacterium]